MVGAVGEHKSTLLYRGQGLSQSYGCVARLYTVALVLDRRSSTVPVQVGEEFALVSLGSRHLLPS